MSDKLIRVSYIRKAILFWIFSAFGYSAILVAQTIDKRRDFNEAFRAIKRNQLYQFDLPPTEPIPDTPRWVKALAEVINALSPLFKVIFYLGIAVIIIFTAYFIITEVLKIRFNREDNHEDILNPMVPLYAPDEVEARILLEDIDKLAAEGRYSEAIHTLLFRSIQDVDKKRPGCIRSSLTSREISQLDILTPKTRETFSLIGQIVEAGFFAGCQLNQADFDNCRAAYQNFTAPQAWGVE